MQIKSTCELTPGQILDLRTYIQVSAPDVWNAQECGLIDDSDVCMSRLSPLSGRKPEYPLIDGKPYTQVTKAPHYIPYESEIIPTIDAGDVMSRLVLSTIFSDELRAISSSGPLAAVAMLTAATLVVGKSKIGAWMKAAGMAIPKKGNEVQLLWPAYQKQCSGGIMSAAPMMIRDYFASIYVWQFIRMTDGRIPDLCGSILSITAAIDYVGADDDPGLGRYDVYLTAMSEGVACLSGPAVDAGMKDAVLSSVFIKTREAEAVEAAAKTSQELEYIISSCGGPVTPGEFMRMRWWDGAMAPYHRIALGSDSYHHLADEAGTFKSAKKCGKIKRAIDSIIRYNEIVDLLSDYKQEDGVNELLVAMFVTGSEGVLGYADALAAVIDDVLTCDCGENGHVEAAEMAMGACLWYVLGPRYLVRAQLDGLANAGGELESAFARRIPEARNITYKMLPGDLLHADGWQPLWVASRAEIPHLVQRAVRRTLLEEVNEVSVYQRCEIAATIVLTDCMTIGKDAACLRALSDKWCHFFDEAISKFAEGCEVLLRDFRELIARIWVQSIIGDRRENSDTDAQLFVDIDRTVRCTYSIESTTGLVIRRAFFGVVSSAIELSGFNPYGRFVDGVARLINEE